MVVIFFIDTRTFRRPSSRITATHARLNARRAQRRRGAEGISSLCRRTLPSWAWISIFLCVVRSPPWLCNGGWWWRWRRRFGPSTSRALQRTPNTRTTTATPAVEIPRGAQSTHSQLSLHSLLESPVPSNPCARLHTPLHTHAHARIHANRREWGDDNVCKK